MQEGEYQVAVGGVQYRRGGCLLAPFIPLKVAGALVVTNRRIRFEPILYYKLVTRPFDLDLDEVKDVQSSGSNMQLNVWELVSIGKQLTLKLKNGMSYSFRSIEADDLAEAIGGLLRRSTG